MGKKNKNNANNSQSENCNDIHQNLQRDSRNAFPQYFYNYPRSYGIPPYNPPMFYEDQHYSSNPRFSSFQENVHHATKQVKNINVERDTGATPKRNYNNNDQSHFRNDSVVERNKFSNRYHSNELDSSEDQMSVNVTRNLAMICLDCQKAVHKAIIHKHRNHIIVPHQEALETLKLEHCDELARTHQQMHSRLISENSLARSIDIWEKQMLIPIRYGLYSIIDKCNSNVKKLKDFCQKVEKSKPGKDVNLSDLLNVKNKLQEISLEKQNMSMNSAPFWLLLNWLKTTLGLILHGNSNVYASMNFGDKKLFAPLTLQGDRILFNCLQNNTQPDSDAVIIPYDYFLPIFEEEQNGAFLSIGHQGQELGFVFVRVDGETFWGRQFLALCTGEFGGTSYKNSKLFRSCGSKSIGQHLWGGDYSHNDGSGGLTILDKSRELIFNPKPIAPGLMASRPGVKDRSSIFRVYLTAPDSANTCVSETAFGFVQEGLDVLQHAASLPDITKVCISEAGRTLILA